MPVCIAAIHIGGTAGRGFRAQAATRVAAALLALAGAAAGLAGAAAARAEAGPCVPAWARDWPAPVCGRGAGARADDARAVYTELLSFPLTSEVFAARFDPAAAIQQFAVGDYAGSRVVLHTVDAALQHAQLPLPIPYGQAWLLEDLDRDGQAELVLQRGDAGMGGNGYLDILSAPAWNLRTRIILPGMKVYFHPVAINADADPSLELFLSPSSLGGTGRILLVDHDPAGGGFVVGADLPAPAGSGGATAAADFDGDGRIEFITGHSAGYQLYECVAGQLYNRGAVGEPYAGSWAVAGRPLPGGCWMPLLGHSSFANGYRYQLLRPTGDNTFAVAQVFQETTGYAGVHPAHALDADGDGLDEFALSFYPACRIIGWDPGAGQFAAAWSWDQTVTGTFLQWADADCDRDGTPEWVCTNHLNTLRFWEDQDTQGLAEGPATGSAGAHAASALDVRVLRRPDGGAAIAYRLEAAAARVCVSLFDGTGRLVRSLRAGPGSAGEHVVRLDRSGIPGGCYFVRVAADARAGTGRLVVAR